MESSFDNNPWFLLQVIERTADRVLQLEHFGSRDAPLKSLGRCDQQQSGYTTP